MQNCGVIDDQHFVNHGHERACKAIREIVRAEFANRWKQANWVERWRLRAEIKREFERRAARLAPPDALY
jgi:hypothetical protein